MDHGSNPVSARLGKNVLQIGCDVSDWSVVGATSVSDWSVPSAASVYDGLRSVPPTPLDVWSLVLPRRLMVCGECSLCYSQSAATARPAVCSKVASPWSAPVSTRWCWSTQQRCVGANQNENLVCSSTRADEQLFDEQQGLACVLSAAIGHVSDRNWQSEEHFFVQL